MPREEARLAQLDAEALEPGFWDDGDNARGVMQRTAALRAHVQQWRSLERRAADTAELVEMAMAEGDDSIEAGATKELDAVEKDLEGLEFQLQLSGEYDNRTAILAIHAGAGGTDAQDFAEMLMRMYLRYAEKKGFAADILDVTEGEEAGIKSTTIEFAGPYAFGYLKSERGVHRLVRQSPFNAGAARQTSFAKVEVIPEVDDMAEIEIKDEDIRIDVFRSSGAGGQNVQKNSTAIRITHLPTGLVVTCQNERSQGRNRESALKVLQSRLLEIELRKQEEEKARLKGEHVDMSFGSQIRNYVLHPYKLVKDLRTNYETSDPTAVLDGELDPFVEAYLRAQVGEGT
ncbi:MAG: peptide chain release factor 2 [Dehalococcoidia bacterium]|nr:peptide chain release factor 2 [Dehalococcoidia bacterium]MCB9486535.1 peptide chain release factor 2 [Thermoflexaceae bacterium]